MEAGRASIPLHASALEPMPGARGRDRSVGWLFAGTGIAVFVLMGLLGLTMRLTQAEVLSVSPAWFYRLMTLHGAGMLTGALLAAMGMLWFVLRDTVRLTLVKVLWSYALIVGGVVLVIVAVGVGGFATGWTFLSPLPFESAGEWRPWAADVFLLGLVLVGTGFLVFCLDVLMATTSAYGGVTRTLGVKFLRGRDSNPPPPAVIAASVVSIEGALASAVGTTVLVALLGRAIDSGVQIDALWAKNLTYFFGHSVANLIIYLAVGMVYVMLPHYVGRPWKTTKPVVIGWMATLVLVATAYSHHLYMDFVQPGFAQYISTTASFAAALPVAVVTIYTGMMLIWGSSYRWTLASTLLFLGFAGWAIGGSAAVIDSIIPLNFRLHNSLWVPAHFHTYLLMGVIMWILAFFAHLLESGAGRSAARMASIAGPALMLVGGYGLVAAWYVSGALGVPRRYAAHFGDTSGYSVIGSVFTVIFALGLLVVLVEFGRLALETWRRRVPAPIGDSAGEQPAGRLRPPIETPLQLTVAVAASVVAAAALLPPIVDASEVSAQFHHLAHSVYFFFGALVAVAVACTPPMFDRVRRWSYGAALAAVIVAPTLMLFAMIPSLYEEMERHEALHALYHMGLITLGVITGLGAARLGRSVGRIVFVLSVGMATMYAAGVTGG
ncbi:MAG: cbb3-type cytochrome c oxidase subunit I [Phycisphaeraceae bacterium]